MADRESKGKTSDLELSFDEIKDKIIDTKEYAGGKLTRGHLIKDVNGKSIIYQVLIRRFNNVEDFNRMLKHNKEVIYPNNKPISNVIRPIGIVSSNYLIIFVVD